MQQVAVQETVGDVGRVLRHQHQRWRQFGDVIDHRGNESKAEHGGC
jgi:hypothetical protein